MRPLCRPPIGGDAMDFFTTEGNMKTHGRADRRLAALRKDLDRLRLGYARILARNVDVKGNLPAKILAVKAKIGRLTQEVARKGSAA